MINCCEPSIIFCSTRRFHKHHILFKILRDQMCAWLVPTCQIFLIRHRSEFHRKQTHTQLNTVCNRLQASHMIQDQFMLKWIFMVCDSIQTDAIDANSWLCTVHIWETAYLAIHAGNVWQTLKNDDPQSSAIWLQSFLSAFEAVYLVVHAGSV